MVLEHSNRLAKELKAMTNTQLENVFNKTKAGIVCNMINSAKLEELPGLRDAFKWDQKWMTSFDDGSELMWWPGRMAIEFV